MNMGTQPQPSHHGLLTTVAYKLGPNAPVHYALEVRGIFSFGQSASHRLLSPGIDCFFFVYSCQGSVAIAGAAAKWLVDNLGIISTPKEIGQRTDASTMCVGTGAQPSSTRHPWSSRVLWYIAVQAHLPTPSRTRAVCTLSRLFRAFLPRGGAKTRVGL